jgi:heme A synthase
MAVVVLLVWVWRACAPGHPARRGAAWTVFFMLTEAAVGAGLVLFQLVAENASMARAMFMAVHLVNTFILLGALTLTAWWLTGAPPLRIGADRRSLAFVVGAFGLLLVGSSGAVAALGDTLFPEGSLSAALAADLSPASHALVRLRVLHPVFAVLLGGTLILGAAPVAAGRGTTAAWLAKAVGSIAALQVVLGFANVFLLAPVWMQMVHLLVADLLWIVFVLLGATVLAAPSEGRAYSWSGTPDGPRFIASAGLESRSNTRV